MHKENGSQEAGDTHSNMRVFPRVERIHSQPNRQETNYFEDGAVEWATG